MSIGYGTSPGTGGGGTIGGSIAATQVAFGTALNTIGGSATFTRNLITGDISIGAASSGDGKLEVTQNVTSDPASTRSYATIANINVTAGVNNFSEFFGSSSTLITGDNFNYSGFLHGSEGQAFSSGTGVIDEIEGVYGSVGSIANGTVNFAAAIKGEVTVTAGTVLQAIGLYSPAMTFVGGAITTAYGLKIDNPGAGATQWTAAIGTGNSYVAGSLSVGKSTAPTFTLDVAGNQRIVQPANVGGSPTLFKVTAGAHTGLDNSEFNDYYLNSSRTVSFIGGGPAISANRTFLLSPPTFTGVAAQSFDLVITAQIEGAPIESTNTSFNAAVGLVVGSLTIPGYASNTVANIATILPGISDGVNIANNRSALFIPSAGTVHLGNQIKVIDQLNQIQISTQSLSASAAVSVTNPSIIYIQGPYTNSGNVTFTNGPYSIFVDDGVSRFDGNGTHVFELPEDATGNVTPASGRIPIKVGGFTKYIRYYND